MQKDVIDTLDAALNEHLHSSGEHLHELAGRLAIWALQNTVNEDGSRLREKGLELAGAIVDWAHELYPEEK